MAMSFMPLRPTKKTYVQGPRVDIHVPTAQIGAQIPYLLGRYKLRAPNLIGYGNPKPIYKIDTTTTVTEELVDDGAYTSKLTKTTTTETKYVVGYLLDMLFGICLGPGVVLHEIWLDDVRLWNGTVGPGRGTLTLPTNDSAFSGVTVAFNGGAFDQPRDPWLTAPDTPAYVGTSYAIFQSIRANLALGALSFVVSRTPNPLGLSAGNNVRNFDLNAATAMYDVIQNGWGGAGVDAAFIETSSFASAATLFAAEGNFCSMLQSSEASVSTILGTLQQQTRSIIYTDPATNKINIKPIRQSAVNPGASVTFDTGNVIEFRDFAKTSWSDTVDQVVGTFMDRASDFKETPVIAQNNSIPAVTSRAKKTVKISYPYVTFPGLAVTLTARDAAILSSPVFTVNLMVNRDGAKAKPGDVVFLTWPEFKLYSVALTVLKARKQPLKSNVVVLTCEQYRFADTTPTIDAPTPGENPALNNKPAKPTSVAFITAPYWIARKRAGISLSVANPNVFPVLLPTPANDFQASFSSRISNMPGASTDVLRVSTGLYPTIAQLTYEIDAYDGLANGIIPAVYIDSIVNPTALFNNGLAGVRSGQNFIVINDEILSYETFTQVTPSQVRLNNVHRGLLDTVKQTHAESARLYIIGGALGNVDPAGVAFPLTYTPNWKITSNTFDANGAVTDHLASSGWLTTVNRTARPLRPHNTKINGVRSASPQQLSILADVVVSWATRSRATLDVALQADAATPGEAGTGGKVQKHTIYLRDSGNTVHTLGSTSDTAHANTLTVQIPNNARAGTGSLWVEAETVNGKSLYADTLPVYIESVRIIEAGTAYRATEDGNYRVGE